MAIKVTPEAIAGLDRLREELIRERELLNSELKMILDVYTQTNIGLGLYSGEIKTLIDALNEKDGLVKAILVLERKLRLSSAIIREHLNKPVQNNKENSIEYNNGDERRKSILTGSDWPAPITSPKMKHIDKLLEPNRKQPRCLSKTEFGLTINDSGLAVYDSPMEVDKYLYRLQGSAYDNIKGTCGLCACLNVLRLAGVLLSERNIIDYAAMALHPAPPSPDQLYLCSLYTFSASASGGTTPKGRQAILKHFGIDSEVVRVDMEIQDGHKQATMETMDRIAASIMSGRGVIISVHSSILNPAKCKSNLSHDYHAVTVSSVALDENGKVSGFYICDSNTIGTCFYSLDVVRRSLTGNDMNVTSHAIR